MSDERKPSLWRRIKQYLFDSGSGSSPDPGLHVPPPAIEPPLPTEAAPVTRSESAAVKPLVESKPEVPTPKRVAESKAPTAPKPTGEPKVVSAPKPAVKRRIDPFPTSPLPDNATQYPGAERSQDSTLTIGLDWGTSCTKVIVRDPYGLNAPSYLVDFGALGHPGQSYLLPSRLYVNGEGEGSLDNLAGSTAINDIKLRLIQPDTGLLRINPNGLSAYRHEIAALYVAATLRHVRTWFLREEADAYKSFRIDWQFNLGIPATSYDDTLLCGLFREVARVGWWLSTQEGPLTLGRARAGFEAARHDAFDPGLDDYALNVVPEVAAQVVGYAKSNLRTTGLHVLVDVGAATLDAAGFILAEREGEDHYTLLWAEVKPRGAYLLHRERVRAVVQSQAVWGEACPETSAWCDALDQACSPLALVSPQMVDYYPTAVRRIIRVPSEPDGTYKDECRRTVHKVVHELRKHKDPRADAWQNGLPIFLCGGGQDAGPYRKGLSELNSWWQASTRVAPFQIRSLPPPGNLKARGLKQADHHRISVAYGLGFPFDDIGQVKPPSAVSALPTASQSERGFSYEDTKDWT